MLNVFSSNKCISNISVKSACYGKVKFKSLKPILKTRTHSMLDHATVIVHVIYLGQNSINALNKGIFSFTDT